ncbi:hypothetical protein [Dictyobacter kobayashii]|uniref:Uncharacterized protein n=1 Tax=Dictyobacter kobayashii TaxID=2014872 RepID=A0A402AQS0_9CHLR|nr:hypothetical protein [Dictyobacter kobayashii]GCE21435.1 hypothetical protein KDK_52350 [Dictyobacter kobayashii]
MLPAYSIFCSARPGSKQGENKQASKEDQDGRACDQIILREEAGCLGQVEEDIQCALEQGIDL